MLASHDLRSFPWHRRLLIVSVLVLVGGSGFEIGRTTAPEASAKAREGPTLVSVGPMSASDRTRLRVSRRMNHILEAPSDA